MKYPTVRVVFDRKRIATKTRKGLVQIEILYGRRRKFVSTNVKVCKDQWDERRMVVNSMQSVLYNSMIEERMSEINGYILQLMKSGRGFDFDSLDSFLNKTGKPVSFVDFVDARVDARNDIGEGTRKHHKGLVGSLRDFGTIDNFESLTRQNIQAYEEWLRGRGIRQSTVYTYMKRLRTYISEAIRYGYLTANPMEAMRLDRGKAEKMRYLTDAELSRIAEAEMPDRKSSNARDVFLFQCYTGLAYADLAKFDFKEDVVNKNGRYILSDRRRKTDEDYFIVILKPALSILKKYKYRLPVISNQKYNDALKVVAAVSGVRKPVSSHYARHTFAVWVLNQGVPIEVLSKMLGHASIRTTQVYAKVVQQSVVDAFDKLEGLF